MTTDAHNADKDERPPVDLRGDGVLWAINRVLFHPRGFALGYDRAQGTFVLLGDGHDVWVYGDGIDEDEYMHKFERLLDRARTYVFPPAKPGADS